MGNTEQGDLVAIVSSNSMHMFKCPLADIRCVKILCVLLLDG